MRIRIRAKHVITLVILGVAGFMIYAVLAAGPDQTVPVAERSDPSGGPRLSLSSFTLNMGKISNDEPTTQTLDITNKGGEPLRIHSVQGSCPCVRAWPEVNPIPPGRTTPLHIEMDPFKISGFQCYEKSVSVRSNDPAQGVAVINVLCDIEPEFTVEPPIIEFGNVAKGETVEKPLLVRQIEDEPRLEVTQIKSRTPGDRGIEWRVEPVAEESWAAPNHAEYRIFAKITPSVRPGPLRDSVYIMTNVERLKNGLKTEARALINASYQLQPGHQIRMVNAQPGEKGAGRLTIEGQGPIKVRGVKVSTRDFVAHLKPSDRPETVFIDIDINESAKIGRAAADLTFTIETEDLTLPETVGLRAYIRSPGGDPADRPEPIRVTPRNR